MPGRPNILVLCADQIRSDALGCYGNPVCRTPHLDALAADGVLCANAYTPNPICVPARASMTTGNYSHKATGQKDNDGPIRDGQVKLAEHFAAAGYATYACGKLHYVPYSAPGQPRLVHGFAGWDSAESGRIIGQYDPQGRLTGVEDYFDYLASVGWPGYSRAHGIGNNDVRPCPSPLPPEHHVDAWVATRTIERLADHRRHRANQPFLLWCSFPKPHSPYDPPFEYANLYDPRLVSPPAGDESLLGDRNPDMERERATRAMVSLSPAARQVIKAYYYGLITFQDAQVGRVMRALSDSGQLDNTIVVYLADHGDLMGDFGTYFKCNWLEGSSHVPMIWRLPGGPKGVRREQLVGLQDLLPTLAGLTGCPLPSSVDGIDIGRLLAQGGPGVREVFYGQCDDAPTQSAMVFDGRWKYCYAQEGPTEELYDLANDPQELVNMASTADGRKLLPQWRRRLIDEARRWGDTALLDGDGLATSPLDREAIRALPIRGMGWRWF
ncbi:MAG: Arylsulfatase [Phycisphaerae bacterium]|nr:Arylsulfatase [Phycisphaerae bacterium]